MHVVYTDTRTSETPEGGRRRRRGLRTESEVQHSRVRRTDSHQPAKVRREWAARAGEPAR